MFTLEEYIAKRKRESKINEFDQEQKLENIKICVDFVLEYFIRYLDISDEEMKSGLHKNKVSKLGEKLNKFDDEIKGWILEVYDKYEVRIDKKIWYSIKYNEFFYLYYSDHDFRELSYKCYNENIEKLPFLKNQGELIFKLIKNLHRIKSESFLTVDSLTFLNSSTVEWLNKTLIKYGVNILKFVEEYCRSFFDKTYDYTPAETHYDLPVVKQYNYKQTKNLFDIDTIYQKLGHKPFIKGHKQEIELLMMYEWTHSTIGDKEYWDEYLKIVMQYIK